MAVTKTILLVDDDNELREALAEQFDLYEGFTVIQAENATQGVKLAESERTDLILLDVDMPDMDGREACKLMRTRGVRAPIIMLTGQDSDASANFQLGGGIGLWAFAAWGTKGNNFTDSFLADTAGEFPGRGIFTHGVIHFRAVHTNCADFYNRLTRARFGEFVFIPAQYFTGVAIFGEL